MIGDQMPPRGRVDDDCRSQRSKALQKAALMTRTPWGISSLLQRMPPVGASTFISTMKLTEIEQTLS
jgi:hypothetical protein